MKKMEIFEKSLKVGVIVWFGLSIGILLFILGRVLFYQLPVVGYFSYPTWETRIQVIDSEGSITIEKRSGNSWTVESPELEADKRPLETSGTVIHYWVNFFLFGGEEITIPVPDEDTWKSYQRPGTSCYEIFISRIPSLYHSFGEEVTCPE